MKNIILLGAPGSGKGTLASDLCPQLKLKHISTGDLLREVVASGSALGKEINAYMTRGELVPDALIGKMIREVLESPAASNGVLLDGYPRTIPQADLLGGIMSELGKKLDAVFYLSIELDVIIKRLIYRVSCKECGKPYHLFNLPPKQKGICDVCGGELIQREDDKEETIRKRYDTYIQKTKPLIDYYKQKKMLIEIDAGLGVAECLKAVLAGLNKK